MDVIRNIDSVVKLIEGVRAKVNEDRVLQRKLHAALLNIKGELGFLSAEVKKIWAKRNEDAEPEEWVLQLQDLAYEIEDFIDERGKDPKTSAPIRIVRDVLLMDPRQEHVDKVEGFLNRAKSIRSQKESAAAASSPGLEIPLVHPEDRPPVLLCKQMQQQIDNLTRMLLLADGHKNQLKVISILGCRGLGKTTLVRELRKVPAIVGPDRVFACSAMVEAPASSDLNLVKTTLQQIIKQVDTPEAANLAEDYEQQKTDQKLLRNKCAMVEAPSSSKKAVQEVDTPEEANLAGEYEQLKTNLQKLLHKKRYLVIIDGVQEYNVWKTISEALPKNDLGSRVVITTRNRTVALRCSSGSYRYTMKGLEGTRPSELFWEAFGNETPDENKTEWIRTLLDKSDGLPLVLIAAAEYLQELGCHLTKQQCKDVADTLGHLIATASEDSCFGKLRRSLAQSCQSRSLQVSARHTEKMCMMSVASFPKGHVIKRKSLLRRVIADGLVGENPQMDVGAVARDCISKLLELGIIHPVPHDDIATNDDVKRCQVHGVMLEFLVHRSLSWNFITLIKDGRLVPSRETATAPRRLCIHGTGDGGEIDIEVAQREVDLTRVRSLTACNISMLRSLEMCKLLRLLDLEGSNWLTDDHIRPICQLLHLKYLSLRSTQVTHLPVDIQNLHCLQTLDLRLTRVDKLPLEVLKLQHIAHIFGKFELPAELRNAKKADRLEKDIRQSKLHTLAGFRTTNNDQGSVLILRHAKMLRKVKIWLCDDDPTSLAPKRSGWTGLKKKIPIFKDNNNKIMTMNKKKVPHRDTVNLPSNGTVVASFPESLVESLRKRLTAPNSLDSLSIHLGSHCREFLGYVLHSQCTVSSIKIWGAMDMLPESQISTLGDLRDITELYLCNTGLRCQDLSVLQRLGCLISLKLADDSEQCWQGHFFIVNKGGFPSLKRLCFNAPRLPNVTFQSGSMNDLLSLQLIGQPPQDHLGVTGIRDLEKLQEVILHPDISDEKIEDWKREAEKNSNMPYVKKAVAN